MILDQETENSKQRAFDEVISFVGSYVVIFQAIENTLDHMLRLVIGLNQYHIGNSVVSFLRNRDKIEVLHVILRQSRLEKAGEEHRTWLERFESVMRRVRKEGERRNRVVHSYFSDDFTRLTGHIDSVTMRAGNGRLKIEYQKLDQETCSAILSDLAVLAQEMKQLHTQLIHWVELVQRQEGVLYRDDQES